MKAHGISGIPVVENGAAPGRLVGILTNRDVRFASDPSQKVAELMTKDRLVTVSESRSTRRRPSGSSTSTGSRSCWSSTTTTAASA